jgi:hypothetical protein
MRDFQFQNKSDILMKDSDSIGSSHRQTSQPHSTNRRLNSSKVLRGDVESLVIIAYKEV